MRTWTLLSIAATLAAAACGGGSPTAPDNASHVSPATLHTTSPATVRFSPTSHAKASSSAPKPSELTLSADGTTLTWIAAPAIDVSLLGIGPFVSPSNYIILTGTTSGATNGPSDKVAGTQTSYVLPPGLTGTYFVTVVALYQIPGFGPYQTDPSNEVVVGRSGPACQAPGIVTGLTSAGSFGSTVKLSWTAPTGQVTGYIIYEHGRRVAAVTGQATFLTADNIANGSYKVTVAAQCGSLTGQPSDPPLTVNVLSEPELTDIPLDADDIAALKQLVQAARASDLARVLLAWYPFLTLPSDPKEVIQSLAITILTRDWVDLAEGIAGIPKAYLNTSKDNCYGYLLSAMQRNRPRAVIQFWQYLYDFFTQAAAEAAE